MAKFVEKYREDKRAYITLRTSREIRDSFNQIAKRRETTATALLREFVETQIQALDGEQE